MASDADGSDGGARALAAPPVNTSRLVIARSLADAVPGEVVAVGLRGQTMTPRQVTAVKVASWSTLVVSGAFVGAVYGYLLSPLAGVIAAVGLELVMLFKMRHWPAFRAAL